MDLISSVVNKVKEVARNMGKKVSDDEGFIRQGQFTPVQAVRDYFNPTYNQGQNFWSTPVAQGLANLQTTVEKSRYEMPRVSLESITPQIKTPYKPVNLVANLPINLARGIAEGIINAPVNAWQTGARIGYDIVNVPRGEVKLTPQRALSDIAPGLEAYLSVAGLGLGKQAIKEAGKELAKGSVKQAIKKGALEGALYGGGFGLAEAASSKEFAEKQNVGSLVEPTLTGAAGGALIGAAARGVPAAIGTLFNKVKSAIREIHPNQPQDWVDKQGRIFVRNELGRFIGLKPLVKEEKIPIKQGGEIVDYITIKRVYPSGKEPRWYGDVREKIGLPREGLTSENIPFGLSVKPTKDENVRMVSQAVKQGHITPEEGQAILEDLAKQGGKIKIKVKPEMPSEIESLKKTNPLLFRTAQNSKTVEEFINKMAKGKPETVDTDVLTNFYNKVKGIPEVKPVEKAVEQVAEKVKPEILAIPKELEPLAEEARKYKSAEEFVSAQRRAFHGSPIKDLEKISFGEGVRSNTFLGGTTKVKSGAIFFTPDKDVAMFFAKNRAEWLKDMGKKATPTVYERYLNIKNPLDLTGKNIKKTSEILDKAGIDLEKEILGIEGFGRDLETLLADKEIELSDLWKIVDKKELVEKLKKVGIDGAIFKETGDRGISYAIFNPEQAFTKSQLIDFYNQATKGIKEVTTPPPTTLPIGESGGEVGKIKIKGSVEPQTAENIRQSIAKAKASGMSFDEWVKGQGGDKLYDVGDSFEMGKIIENPFKEGIPSSQKVQEINKIIASNKDKYNPKYIKFYHATDPSLPVLEKGLLPTSATRRRSLQSASGYVYLANTPERAKVFGDLGNQSKSVVYEVVVPVNRILPDLDQLNNIRSTGEKVGNTIGDSIVYGGGIRVRGKIEPYAIRKLPDSLQTRSQLKAEWDAVKVTPEAKPEIAKIKIKGEPMAEGSRIGDLPKIGENISQFTETVKTSPKTPKKIKEVVENAYYRPTTNVQDIANAQNTLSVLGWDKAKEKLLKEPLTSENSMLGQIMASKAFSEGKFDEGNEIIKNLSLKATKSGQSIQALSVWSKFTPEGMVKFAQKEIENANNSMPLLNKILGKKGEWTAEDSKFITEQMKKINTLTDEAQRAEATREVFDYISKKLPWGASDLIDEFRYNNLLSNPLTHLRNAINNLQQTFLVRPLTLAAEGKPIEAVKYEIGTLKSLPNAFDAFKQALKGKQTFGKMDVSEIGSQLQKPKRLGAYNLPSNAMEAADKFFSTLIIGGEKARGKSAEEALKSAEYSLFRQDLKPEQQGVLLNKIDDITRAVYQLRKVGLGWFIPFIRTPMNIAKQWIEYSPAGFATTIGAANKREQVAKALLGTLATAIGAELALQDRVTWAAPTDPLQKKLFYDSGRKPYSIKIGDKWIPMQNAGVFAWALGIPAAVKYYTQDSREALSDDQITKLTKIMTSIAGFWSNQTFVSGLASFVKLAEGDIDYSLPKNIGYSLGQLKPMEGLMRYVATVIDPVFRKSRTIGEQLISDIPFLTKQLPAYETTLGEPATRNITNYIAPYAWGFENKQFEEPYQQRTKQLQENALINKIKNEMESDSKQVGDKLLITTQDGNVKVLDLSKIMPSDTDTNYEKALKQKKAFSYVDDILDSNMSVDEKGQALAKLRIDPEDAAYYNVARQDNDIKDIYVRDEIGKYGDNRQEMLLGLVKLRREVNGEMILANEVITSLYEDGIISYDEAKWLKNAKYTKDGQVKVKLSGRGKSAKLKSITYRAKKLSYKVPKLKAIKSGGVRKGIPGRGRIFKTRKVTFK